MRYPKHLQKNGTIGLLAPSFGCAIEPYKSAFNNALKKWEDMGYRTKLGPNCYAGEGIGISNAPTKCGQEVMDSFLDEESDVLISCGGGELMCEVLPYVDFEVLAHAEPKWFMGYSDNPNFTFLSAILMDTAAIYGPCAAAFGMEPWHPSLQDAYDVLSGKTDTVKGYGLWEKESLKDEAHPLLPYNVTENSVIRKFPDENVELEGRLLGGCMDILQMYPGTAYDKVKEFLTEYNSVINEMTKLFYYLNIYLYFDFQYLLLLYIID